MIDNVQTVLDDTQRIAANNGQTALGKIRDGIAKSRLQEKINKLEAELIELSERLAAAYAKYEETGQDFELIDESQLEREGRTERNGEYAFIVIAALAGGGFTFAMLELPLPWFVALPLLLGIWLVLSWAFTFAMRAGVQVALNVKYNNPQGQERAVTLFRVAFGVFLISLLLNVASRLLPIPPETFGITAVTIEISALLCAACLGALANAKSYISELVEQILNLQRRINVADGKLKMYKVRLKQFDGEQPANQNLLD
jgi:hypothetical protein